MTQKVSQESMLVTYHFGDKLFDGYLIYFLEIFGKATIYKGYLI